MEQGLGYSWRNALHSFDFLREFKCSWSPKNAATLALWNSWCIGASSAQRLPQGATHLVSSIFFASLLEGFHSSPPFVGNRQLIEIFGWQVYWLFVWQVTYWFSADHCLSWWRIAPLFWQCPLDFSNIVAIQWTLDLWLKVAHFRSSVQYHFWSSKNGESRRWLKKQDLSLEFPNNKDSIRKSNIIKYHQTIWQCVKTLYPCSSHQNSWVKMDVHPSKNGINRYWSIPIFSINHQWPKKKSITTATAWLIRGPDGQRQVAATGRAQTHRSNP